LHVILFDFKQFTCSLPEVKKKIVVGHMWVKESMVGGLPWWVE